MPRCARCVPERCSSVCREMATQCFMEAPVGTLGERESAPRAVTSLVQKRTVKIRPNRFNGHKHLAWRRYRTEVL